MNQDNESFLNLCQSFESLVRARYDLEDKDCPITIWRGWRTLTATGKPFTRSAACATSSSTTMWRSRDSRVLSYSLYSWNS